MVLELLEVLCVAGVWVVWVDHGAYVGVFKVFAVHFCEVGLLCCPDEGQCGVKFFVIGTNLGVYVVVVHCVGDSMHGSLN